KESQEGNPPPSQSQEPLKPMENVSRPIHNPLVLKTNFEEEEEEEEEQNDASSLWTKTPEEIEEKRAIKEMCYKSGEYYRSHASPDMSSSKSTASTPEKELEKPLENGSELQEGDGLTVPTKLSLLDRPGEAKTSLDRKPRTDMVTFENGGGDCYTPQSIVFLGVDESEAIAEVKEITSKCSNVKEEKKDSRHPKRPLTTRLVPTTHILNATQNIRMKYKENPSSMNDVQPVRKPHFKGVKKRKWTYDEPKNLPGSGMRRAAHNPNPKHKASYHHHNKNRNAENASCMPVQRDSVRTVTQNAPPQSRPTGGSYNKADVNKEPKLNLCPDKHMSTSYNGSTWRRRIPFSKTYSKAEKIYPERAAPHGYPQSMAYQVEVESYIGILNDFEWHQSKFLKCFFITYIT
ncbi:hypothetical protein STEG23_025731, partial [Scotinomys teguina]